MLTPCARCRRHISIRDEVCRFCQAIVIAAGAALGGCDAGEKVPRAPQVQRTVAKVHGVVKNNTGAALERALVVLRAEGKEVTRIETAADGRYVLDNIQPGAYEMSVHYQKYDGALESFGGADRTLVLAAGDDKTLDFALDVREMHVAPPYGAPPARRRVV